MRRSGRGHSSSLYPESSQLTFDSSNIDDWAISGSQIAIAGVGSDLSFDTVTISGGTTAGVKLSQGTMNANSTTFSGSGYGLAVYDSDVTLTGCTLTGNTVGLYAHQNATVDVTDTNINNNNTVLVGGSGAAGLTQVSGLLTHSHNLLDGFGTPFSGTTADASELLKNPRFVDAANGDFRLAKGSPAINSGADLTASVTVDMLGNARPSHKVFEIGAYEYMLDGGSLRVLNWKEER